MALYVLGDTHFSDGADKPMDIFGGVWLSSRQKLLDGFGGTLKEGDTLVLCGDFSWGMTLDEALPDFKLISQFPGKKIFLKGNHDYWWETVSKMSRFFGANGIEDIHFLHNNCFFYGNVAICGTRGWFLDKTDPACSDEKVFRREVMRLEASLKAARSERPDCRIFSFLHYPPLTRDFEAEDITALLKSYSVERCFFGHLHGMGIKTAINGDIDGVYYSVISADAVGFKPVMILE